MIVMSYPISNAFSQQAALGFLEEGLLEEYWTCLRWRRGTWPDRLLPAALTRELRRRALPAEMDRVRVRTYPWREAGRMLASRLPGGASLARHEAGPFSVDQVFQSLDRRVARRLPAAGVCGVYAYEDGAEASFAAAGRLGIKRLYDLPIGYWRAGHEIYAEEALREPAWAATLTGRADSPAKLARKDAELAQADAIFAASTFTRQTLALAPGVRCPVHVVPYGAPPPLAAVPNDGDPASAPKKLRVLFAGSLGQRKGLSYLLAAVDGLADHVELTLLGSKTVEGCDALDEAVRVHRWIPSLPHAAVLAEMERQDVLVFPSLFEGFGLVILEAMSRGLPVIATTHTAAPDLITDGEEGFIVPIRSADAIVEKLELLIRDPARLREMKAAALARAAAHRWQDYRHRLSAAVRQTLSDVPCHADA